MRIFAEDLGFPEGPVLLPDDSLLLVEMAPDKGCTTHVSSDGRSRRLVARTGRPNGLALDRHENVWVAETAMRALLKMNLDGEHEVFATACEGEDFLFLNDVAIAPNGDICVTDSGILLDAAERAGETNADYRSLDYDGRVYRIDAATKAVECIDHGLRFANGIAFGPDDHLYVSETMSGNIYRYRCKDGRAAGKRELFGNVVDDFDAGQLKGPDGMKFGADGNLYVCVFGQGDVTVLDRQGRVVNRIETQGSLPTNLCFARDGAKKIYVTEVETGTLQLHDVETDGQRLCS